MIWRISLWFRRGPKRNHHLCSRDRSAECESPIPSSESTEGMLPSADFPREGSKDLCTTAHQTASLPLPTPANSVTRPAQGRHKQSPAAEHTLGRDLASPPRPQELQSYKVHTKTCFQPLANIIETLSKSCCPAASLLPKGISERTITHGKPGNKIAPSHPLNYKSQLPGGHREVGASSQE